MRSAFIFRLAASALIFGVARADGQQITFGELPTTAAEVDLSVPDSPAFTALGLTPDGVTRPATPRELAAGLLTALDRNGNFQAGLALEAAPWMLIEGDDLTIAAYREEGWRGELRRIASRFQTSAATTKGTDDDDESVRLGIGFYLTPWDKGDPRMDQELDECLMKDALNIPSPAEFQNRTAWKNAVREKEKEANTLAEACHTESEKRLWNASAWSLGFAPTWIQPDGTSDDVEWGGGTAWSSLALRLGSAAQFITGARYRFDEDAPDPEMEDVFREQDVLLVGGRMRIGRPSQSLYFSLDAVYNRSDRQGVDADDSFEGVVSSEIKITDQLWLNLGVGGSAGRDDDNRIFVLSTFKWGGRTFDLGNFLAARRSGD